MISSQHRREEREYSLTEKQVKGVKFFQITYPAGSSLRADQLRELNDCLLLESQIQGHEIQEIWVFQPRVGQFELVYKDSPYFDLLAQRVAEERSQYGYQGMVTASLFAKDGQVIAYNTQDLGKHHLHMPEDPAWWELLQTKFDLEDSRLAEIRAGLPEVLRTTGLDVREALKHFIPLPSGVGYDLNPGSHRDNHSEARTLFGWFGVTNETELDEALADPQNEEKLDKLRGSTCYLYGHWWSCADCSRKMEKVGVTKVVMSRQWVKGHVGL